MRTLDYETIQPVRLLRNLMLNMGSPGNEVVKNPLANAGDAGDTRDAGFIAGSGRSPGEGNGNPCHGQGAWWATIHGVTKSGTRLSI